MAKSTAKGSKKKEENSVFDLLPKSWELVKKNWQVFAFVNIFAILGALGQSLSINDQSKDQSFVTNSFESLTGTDVFFLAGGFFLVIAMVAVVLFFEAMNISLGLKSAKNKKPTISELFEDGKKYYFRLIGLFILCTLIIVIGFALLIVPGVIALSRLLMSPYLMIEKDLGVIEAIKQSNTLATGKIGVVWAALGLSIAVGIADSIISVLPLIGPLAGIVISIGFSLIIPLRYIQMKNKLV